MDAEFILRDAAQEKGNLPGFLAEACTAFPGHVMVSLDAKDGKVAVDGWSKMTGHEVLDRYDHRHLNLDAPEFAELNPTPENLVRVVWRRLERRLLGAAFDRRLNRDPSTPRNLSNALDEVFRAARAIAHAQREVDASQQAGDLNIPCMHCGAAMPMKVQVCAIALRLDEHESSAIGVVVFRAGFDVSEPGLLECQRLVRGVLQRFARHTGTLRQTEDTLHAAQVA